MSIPERSGRVPSLYLCFFACFYFASKCTFSVRSKAVSGVIEVVIFSVDSGVPRELGAYVKKRRPFPEGKSAALIEDSGQSACGNARGVLSAVALRVLPAIGVIKDVP